MDDFLAWGGISWDALHGTDFVMETHGPCEYLRQAVGDLPTTAQPMPRSGRSEEGIGQWERKSWMG